ncbi:MAG: phosphotransferase, partial [Acidimicrobiales bacterium]|nr:phosphotransferase [Acidimicrobiales bacterium]
YELVAPDGVATVCGVVHHLVPGALDGWALVRAALAGDPGGVLARLRDLGVATARLHRALGTAGDDPSFGAEPLAGTALWSLADRLHADPVLGDDGQHAVAHLLDAIGADTGAAIRTHGDLHLGQTMVGPDGWVIFDFEGEPARPLADRAERRSPLRDVAGLLRSVGYARATHERDGGRPVGPGWEAAARAALLDGYLATVDPALLPTSAAAVHRLLTLHELEKLAYEVAYERAHRPDWEAIPLGGLQALVERVGS